MRFETDFTVHFKTLSRLTAFLQIWISFPW